MTALGKFGDAKGGRRDACGGRSHRTYYTPHNPLQRSQGNPQLTY
ncbi:MAG: hypothetical protein ACYTXI_39750 [Nostoc sp.]